MDAQNISKVTRAVKDAYPGSDEPTSTRPTTNEIAATREPPLPVYTVPQFSERNPAFTESALRNLIFKAEPRHSSKGIIPGNGLIEAGAIIRRGRKVLLHEPRFFAWLDSDHAGSER